MKKLLLLPALGLAILPLIGTQPSSSPLTRAASETYQVDNGHSTILFGIKHLDAANFWGRFNECAGSFVLDSEDASNNSITIDVMSESVDTNSEGRDKHIKSDDFFAAKAHPKISFQSTQIEKLDDHFKVTGALSFLGKDKEVTLMAHQVGRKEAGGRFGTRAGLEAELTIKRSDFGNTTYVTEGTLGDDVRLIISLEGVLEG